MFRVEGLGFRRGPPSNPSLGEVVLGIGLRVLGRLLQLGTGLHLLFVGRV